MPLTLGLVVQVVRLAARSRAWRNVLAAAYPDEVVRWRSVFAAYAAGAASTRSSVAEVRRSRAERRTTLGQRCGRDDLRLAGGCPATWWAYAVGALGLDCSRVFDRLFRYQPGPALGIPTPKRRARPGVTP